MVWNLQGQLIYKINPIGYSNTVDLSSKVNGIYVMRLLLNGKGKEYKIIKNYPLNLKTRFFNSMKKYLPL